MKYLLFLNRFEFDRNKLKNKISKLDNSATFEDGEKVIIVDSKLDAGKFMQFQEIFRVVILFKNWKDFGFQNLKKDCLDLCNDKNIKKYFIENKFYDKVPISAKSLYKHINPYLKHDGLVIDEENGTIIYIELKKFNDKLMYRLGYAEQNLFNKVNVLKVDMNKFAVVIENPNLVNEVSDFLRLCWIFKLPLHIITNDKIGFEKILRKAKEETKGIDYEKFDINISKGFPTGYILVGFSKHSDKNEKDMKEVLLNEKKIALVFGDDKFGLSQEARDKLNYSFRLTPEIKKPLRASQALSYVLGFYTAYNLK